MHIKTDDLVSFILESNMAGFAGGDAKQWKKEADGSTTIFFRKDKWKSHDNFFGGEPYGGRIIVSYDDKPVWIMVYYGWVKKGITPEPIYEVLKHALKRMPASAPYRGPHSYKEQSYRYTNTWTGSVIHYKGKEKISEKNTIIYEASYMGGLVNL